MVDSESIDKKDWLILAELQADAKATTSKIAKKTGIPITTVHNRMKRMEQNGIIKRYIPELDYKKLGLGLHALIFVTVENKQPGAHAIDQEELAKHVLGIRGIERASILTGGFDLVLDARARDVEELNSMLVKEIRKVPGIDKTETMLVLHEQVKR